MFAVSYQEWNKLSLHHSVSECMVSSSFLERFQHWIVQVRNLRFVVEEKDSIAMDYFA